MVLEYMDRGSLTDLIHEWKEVEYGENLMAAVTIQVQGVVLLTTICSEIFTAVQTTTSIFGGIAIMMHAFVRCAASSRCGGQYRTVQYRYTPMQHELSLEMSIIMW